MNALQSAISSESFKPSYENNWSTWWRPQNLNSPDSAIDQIKQTLHQFVHELRTPLTILMTAKGLLEQTKNPDFATQNLLNTINNNCNRLNDLVGDYSHLIDIGSEQHPVNRNLIVLNQHLRSIVDDFQVLANANKIKIKLDLPDFVVVQNHDPKILTQILNNLLANALRFATTEIVVSLKQDEQSNWIYTVSDDGAGIAADKQAVIFSPYVQLARKSDASGYAGLGLGLAIVKALIEQHQGKIWVESSMGKGTKFSFVLGS